VVDPQHEVTDKYSLETIVRGLADDLTALRSGSISIKDAQARAELAKQYMNGVRLVLNARNSLESQAKVALPSADNIDA